MVHAAWAKNNICQVRLIGVMEGQEVVIRHHFEAPGTVQATLVTDALSQTWAQTVGDQWRTTNMGNFRACLPTNYTLNTIRTQVLEVKTQFEHRLAAIDITTGLPLAGTGPSTTDDLTTCENVKWRSLLAGRHRRGRSMLPCPTSWQNLGKLAAGGVTALNTYVTSMLAEFGVNTPPAGSGNLTIYSRPYNDNYYVKRVGGVPTVVHQTNYDGDSNNVVSGVADTNLRVQRRREVGVGS